MNFKAFFAAAAVFLFSIFQGATTAHALRFTANGAGFPLVTGVARDLDSKRSFFSVLEQLGPITFTLEPTTPGGTIPFGITVGTDGNFAPFTPTSAGNFSFVLRATDSERQTDTFDVNLIVEDPVVVEPVIAMSPAEFTLTRGYVGEQLVLDVDATITPSDGFSLLYEMTPNRLVDGLTFDSGTGLISGTPTQRFVGARQIKAIFSRGQGENREIRALERTYDFSIGTREPLPPIVLRDTNLASATFGQPYNHDFNASGGDGESYSFSIVGALPQALTGMTINSETGQISVTPTAEGTFEFDVSVSDSISFLPGETQRIVLVVNPGPPLPTMLPAEGQTIIDGKVGDSFNVDTEATLTPNNGFTVVYELTTGVLPAGLTLNTSNGNITGTATAKGQSSFTIKATFTKAGSGQTYFIEQYYYYNVRRAVEPPPVKLTNLVLADAFINTPFTHDFDATGGESGRYSFTKYNVANLPAALSSLTIDGQTGVMTVTPTATGTFTFDILVIEEGEGVGGDIQTLTLNVDELPAVLLTDFAVSNGKVGEAFTHDFNATGGNGLTYSFSINGALPDGLTGLTINQQTGVINVTPSASGTLTFGVKVIDADNAGNFDLETIALVVAGLPAVQLTNLDLGNGMVGTLYAHDFNAIGGDDINYRFALDGALPQGLSSLTINQQTGGINFTPANAGTFTFDVKVTDANDSANFDVKTVTLIVDAAPVPDPVATMTPDAGFEFTAANGVQMTPASVVATLTPPAGYTVKYEVWDGFNLGEDIVFGVKLNPDTGVISGRPDTIGDTFRFSVRATFTNIDANVTPIAIEKPYKFTLISSIALTNTVLPNATVGRPYVHTFGGTGGSGSYRFSKYNDAQWSPELAGFVVDAASGLFSGTPQIAGTFTFQVLLFNPATGSYKITLLQLTVLDYGGPPTESLEISEIQKLGTQASATISGEIITETVGDAASDAMLDSPGSSPLVGYDNGVMIIASKAKMTPAVEALDELVVADRKAMRLRARGSVPGLFSAYGESDNGSAGDRVDPARWSVWSSIRGTRLETGSSLNNLDGTQYNLLAGASYRWSPEMVVGAFTGYETFKFANDVGANLDGNGYTAGAYIGYKPNNGLRFDGQLSSTWLNYDTSSGAVTGSYDGTRIIGSVAVTGSKTAAGFLFEPSLRVTGVWEEQSAYVDSAATARAARNFTFGKVSAGVKTSKNYTLSETASITPFVGVYADYRFSGGDTSAASDAFDDLSARATFGFNAKVNQSTTFSLNGDVSGLGLEDALLLSLKAQLGIQF